MLENVLTKESVQYRAAGISKDNALFQIPQVENKGGVVIQAIERWRYSMRFHANHVSTTASGDYYQALFEERDDSSDADGPYLLIQRQFEMPDDDECYVETHNEEYVGHFRLCRAEFSPRGISIEIDRPNNERIDVTFAMTPDEYEAALPIVKIITEQSA